MAKAEELPIEEEVLEEPEEETQQPEEPTAAVEEQAKAMGWVPKDEFRGDERKWRPAEHFLERGRTMIPILNAKIKNLQKQQEEKDKSFMTYLSDMRNKLHERDMNDHEAKKRQAVDEGDTEAYNRLSTQAPANDLPEYKPPQQTQDPVFDEWKAENNWYDSDYEKHQEAENYGNFLKNTRPDLMGRDFLDEVSTHVKQKFSNPNRIKPSAVDGGTQKASSTNTVLFNQLEADAKAMFNTFVTQGIFKNTKADREAYAQDVLG